VSLVSAMLSSLPSGSENEHIPGGPPLRGGDGNMHSGLVVFGGVGMVGCEPAV
jgi:hypothetical protein